MAARQSRSAVASARQDNADPVSLRESSYCSRPGRQERGRVQPPLSGRRSPNGHSVTSDRLRSAWALPSSVGANHSAPPRAPIDGYLFLSLRAPTWRAIVSLCRHRLREALRRYPPARSCCFLSFSDSIRSARCMGRACNPTVHPAAMADAVRAPRKPLPTISRPLVGRAARIDSAQVSFVATLPA